MKGQQGRGERALSCLSARFCAPSEHALAALFVCPPGLPQILGCHCWAPSRSLSLLPGTFPVRSHARLAPSHPRRPARCPAPPPGPSRAPPLSALTTRPPPRRPASSQPPRSRRRGRSRPFHRHARPRPTGAAPTPTSWIALQNDGPNHLGVRCKALLERQMAWITSGCVPVDTAAARPP